MGTTKPLSWYRRFYSRRFHNIGIDNNLSKVLADRLVYQIDKQGEIEALNYFKRLGDSLVAYVASSKMRPSWVKLTKRGFPVMLLELRDYSEEILLRISKVARSIRFDEIKPHQVDKVRSAPLLPFNGKVQAVEEMTALIKAGLSHSGLLDVPFSPLGKPRRVVDFFHEKLSESGKTETISAPPLKSSIRLVANVPQLRYPGWEDTFWPVHPNTLAELMNSASDDRANFVGSIHAVQEGGGKLRMFASPYTVVQCLLYPIHDWIAKFNKLLTTNCTYDQMSGAKWAQGKLQQGVTVHSVDLSTATCRFPFEPQVAMLQELGLPIPYLEALIWACKGDWKVAKELKPSFKLNHMSWVVGQPLGLAPSMSMFSLAHNMLLWGMSSHLGLNPEDSFRVLGDDVLISDDKLADWYTNLTQEAGIPISWNKSHSSDKYAEFAGCAITPKTILRPGQWRTPTIGSILGVADSVGAPTYGEVSQIGVLIQEAYLFGKGEFTPPPAKWPLMLRISSAIRSLKIMQWSVPTADYKYYMAMEEYDRQLVGVGNYLPPWKPCSFVWDSPNLQSAAFSPLISICPEEYMDVVLSFRSSSYIFCENIGIAAMQAYACACFLFDIGVVPDQESLSSLLEKIEGNVTSLLWLKPTKGGLHRRLRKLESFYAKVVREALQPTS